MAGRYDISIVTGSDFGRVWTWLSAGRVPIDLTGWTAHMQIRAAGEPGALYADLTFANGGIALGGTAGTIALTIAAQDTAAFPPGVARYDLFVTNAAGNTACLLYGNVTVREAETRGS